MAREAAAISDFRSFFANYRAFIALTALRVSQERTNTYLIAEHRFIPCRERCFATFGQEPTKEIRL